MHTADRSFDCRRLLRWVPALLVVLIAGWESPAHGQSLRASEGPWPAPNRLRSYRVGDERVRFLVRTIEGVNFELDALGKAARLIARDGVDRDIVSHVWDGRWYFYGLPDVATRKKYLLVIAHNTVRDEIGWIALSRDAARWNVMNNEGTTASVWNGGTARFPYEFNGRRVDLEVYNPHEGGWSASEVFYRIGEPLDPQIRLNDEIADTFRR